MHYIVTFESDRFDLKGEDPNPINPIQGQSIGRWIAPLLESNGVETTEIAPEDWGWYLEARIGDRWYLVGFVGFPADEEPVGDVPELIIQVQKHRSFVERLTFKERMDESDRLLLLVVELVRALQDVRNVQVERVG